MIPSGKIKVPHGEEAIEKFILGEFKDAELKVLKKSIKKAVEAIDMIILESREKAMSVFNAQ
jgi:peptidyl-tRNA hydrolase